MKKKLILSVVIVLAIIASTLFLRGGLTYFITSLMALVIMGTIYMNRSGAMKMTRWAKANPKKTQFLIAGMHLMLLVMGIFAGYNLKELGYELPGTATYVFSAIIIISYLSVDFLPKRRTIAIPQEVNRQRLAYMGIALSSFVMMVLFGNKLQDKYPNSLIADTVRSIDQTIFPENNTEFEYLSDTALEPGFSKNYEQASGDESTSMVIFASFENETILPPPDLKKQSKANLKAEKKAKKFEKKKTRLMNQLGKKRMSLAAGLTTGAVLLIILLVLAACTGACLIVGGVAALIDGELLGILAILAGAGIGYLSIKGIGNVSRKDKEKQQNEQTQKSELKP
jgi:hypothetical protein